MRRREFITLLGGAATAWPFVVCAQQSDRKRIGVLRRPEGDEEADLRYAAWRRGMEQLGWIEGRNVMVDYRRASVDRETLDVAARELVALRPNILFTGGSPATEALMRASRVIPIVFAGASDPVASGLVSSLSRPGGNVTGFANFEDTIGGKWLELLKDLSPRTRRVLALMAAGNSGNDVLFRATADAARSFGVQLKSFAITSTTTAAELENSIDAFGREPNSGLIIFPNNPTRLHRHLIISAAARHRMPVISNIRSFAQGGALLSYGIDSEDVYRRAASYVDRILKGASPADLPVQAPTKFELVINLRTAKALGLTIPEPFIQRADEVIE